MNTIQVIKNGHHEEKREPADGAAEILLVEDDPADAELTIRALADCGYSHRVEHVTDGADALDYIASTALFVEKHVATIPKLILLDLKLNNMSGLQVLRQLKADERTRGIPIVVLTASKVAIEVLESYKLGVNSYVIKPPNGKQFADVVAKVGTYWLTINQPPPL